jgi:hypothetical protein
LTRQARPPQQSSRATSSRASARSRIRPPLTTTKLQSAFALERDELGTGIDNARQGSGTISAFYASGDQVKVGVFHRGQELTAFIASGESIAEDDLLESAGDGTLKEGTGYTIARAMETLGTIAAVTACRVQII